MRDAVGRAVKTRGDVDVLHPLRGVEHDPRSLHHPKGQRHRRCAPLKLDTLVAESLITCRLVRGTSTIRRARGTSTISPRPVRLLYIIRRTCGRVHY